MFNLSQKICSVEDARQLAKRRMPRMMFDFVDGAAGMERAAQRNQTAFAQIQMQPRVLVSGGDDLTVNILGMETQLPFGVAPMGMCNLARVGADKMLAAAAVKHRIPLCVSMAASTEMSEFQREAKGCAWFQLYAMDSVEEALRMANRARDAGYTHLILTADVPYLAHRTRDLKNGFRVPFRLGAKQFMDFALHPRWSLETLIRGVPRTANFSPKGSGGFDRDAPRNIASWDFLNQLRDCWRDKLIVKGVMSATDALRIRDIGVDAIYVSNHGGRQLDSAPPAINALAEIRATVGVDYPIIFDSGVRSGEDVVKAYALGASFVMLGRAMLYAIGGGGAHGLAKVFDLLANEVRVVLAQLGAGKMGDLTADNLFSTLEKAGSK